MTGRTPTGGLIYGIRLRSESVYRYVGLTTKTAQVRLRQHLKVAGAGTKTPFYDWLRKQQRDDVTVDPLDWTDGLDELGEVEIAWISLLRPNFGRSASEETRAKMSAVRKGRPMPSSRRSAHTRYHTNRGIKKDTCQYCIEGSS